MTKTKLKKGDIVKCVLEGDNLRVGGIYIVQSTLGEMVNVSTYAYDEYGEGQKMITDITAPAINFQFIGSYRILTTDQDEDKALRYNEGKPQWSLVDFESLEDMVKVLEFGAKKYSRDNWKKGLYTVEICESLLRHVFKYLSGEDIDPESGEPHIGSIQANSMFLGYMDKNKPEFDNRVKNNKKQ